MESLQKQCVAEQVQQAKAVSRAWGDKGRQRALGLDLPACIELEDIFGEPSTELRRPGHKAANAMRHQAAAGTASHAAMGDPQHASAHRPATLLTPVQPSPPLPREQQRDPHPGFTTKESHAQEVICLCRREHCLKAAH